MCYNYGHQPLVNGSYDQTQVYGDLAELKASGVNCLRLAYYGYIYAPSVYASGDTNPQKLATMIQAWEVQNNWHFSLIIGGDFDTISSSDFSTYDAAAVAMGQWAQAHGVEQVSLGNEQEYRLSGLSVAPP